MEMRGGEIVIDKVLNKLDLFVIGFLDILAPHTSYVLVSGYVSILFGRSRISEDVDVLVPKLGKEAFLLLHQDLLRNGFWCLNSDDEGELYALLETKHSIRYGKDRNPFPNMELKFVRDQFGQVALQERVVVRLPGKTMHVSPLELQIAYKEIVLASDKDKEDALHLSRVFEDRLDKERIASFKRMMANDGSGK